MNEDPEIATNAQNGLENPLLPETDNRRVRFATAARIFNSKKQHRLNLTSLNQGNEKLSLYYRDIFHTLVNMPNYRFLLIFVASYVSMYMLFALLYQAQPTACIARVQQYHHALWFSVHTSATIGYGHMFPDPDCYAVNLVIMCQVLTTCLMQAALLGLVYARFSAPSKRASTIKFSKVLAMYRGNDGMYRLAFRVANMRKHQVLRPEVRMLMLSKQSVEGGLLEYRYQELPLKHIGGGALWLGVPSIMAHKVDATSPLWQVDRVGLEDMDLEFVVLLDGVDETTSAAMQARHSYFASDINWNMRFTGLLQRHAAGGLTADYSCFDLTTLTGEAPLSI